jgi:hypothetical protein
MVVVVLGSNGSFVLRTGYTNVQLYECSAVFQIKESGVEETLIRRKKQQGENWERC